MLTKIKQKQKKDLYERIFIPHSDEDRRLKHRRVASVEEVKRFLELSGRDHRKYFQYTDLNAFLGMLKSGQLWLTRADKLNDLKEAGTPSARKTAYVASFGSSALENVAMWWMYGLNGEESKRIPVRLDFHGKTLQSLVAKLAPNNPNMNKDVVRPVSVSDGRAITNVEGATLHDMLYQRTDSRISEKTGKRRHGAVSWNGLIAGDVRCPAFKNARENLPDFVKDVGWAYENETRLTIRLLATGPHPERIAIPFVEVLKTVRVIVGPGRAADRNLQDAITVISAAPKTKELSDIVCWPERVHPSFYQVNFTKENT